MQLKGLRFLTRQGIAIRGHHELEGNLQQLLITWSENNESIKNWIKENRFTCHQSVNEQISLLGQAVLRNLLEKTLRNRTSMVFNVINSEQLNLSIRWVNDNYIVQEDWLV